MSTDTGRRTQARSHRGRGSWAASGLVVTCAISAGVHAGLVPEHLQSEPREGAAFIVAAVLLLAVAGGVSARPDVARLAGIAAVLFAGLVCAYVATRTSGIPWLAPDRESVDALGVVTNVVELAGLALALGRLLVPHGRPRERRIPQEVPR